MTKHKSGNYEVGYGKPPRDRRFKPGQSGNPRGRPKRTLSLLELFASELKRTRTIVEDGQRLRVQTDRILIKRIIDLALKGDLRALKIAMALIEQVRDIASTRDDRNVSAMSPEELAAYYNQLRSIRPGDALSNKVKRSFT
ncbi:DUF5681 domain-containing protein [Bradyrhizobium diazoefficiens]|uniref:DUF5681 domain-containing protein n=1 Tax=Bradyrhizobium TaxID=374 RepID=UPI0009B749EA|nr:DUF5681 domain-containing protein [Bradyrhizobium diazoefficiens]MCD9298026.1 DUF5681 domain-containing protein [Bradyrhizobium diazoefficiens]MCD9815509.1 DUF5681 domain-containing protein [Bradyrhizobium diazoefficiens]MCD9833437.1 DUF5681 domain-containing protein [Bradyrhizobium diazoefficiens]MCD9852105.1 DUF5681 domain-containing protein [Bradyrhizobium diazoefficiens]MCD9888352.1 DUF5681 domain-containing protein [Bradyrhizobium diazoefficiens]